MEDSASQKAKVKAQKSKVEGRAGSARQNWLTRAVVGLLLLAATFGVVRYWSASVPSTRPLTPDTQSLPLPDKPFIVVLPFDNMSKDPEQDLRLCLFVERPTA
jgi:hypothetical protein